jgi:hypothetical protein
MRDRVSPRNVLRELRRGWPDALEIMKALPPLAKRLIERAQDGDLRLPVDTRELERLREEWSAQRRRSDRIVIGAALMLGGILWLGLRLFPRPLGFTLAALGLGVWLVVWLARSRTLSGDARRSAPPQ